MAEEDSLLSKVALEDRTWWRVTHAVGFVTGGVTFIAGTYIFYLPPSDFMSYLSAWLYIIGSAGFLYVDVQEFFTFIENKWLRINISMSATGSTLYIIGSVGFLPNVAAMSPLVGILGFIGGSFFIGVSQLWKLVRINNSGGICSSKDNLTAACVEGGACIGAWWFFVGTILFWYSPVVQWQLVLLMWMAGSFFFTFGGVSLTYRHAVMGVC